MSFNYGFEKKKFEKEWSKLRKEYAEAGMSESAIQELYEYDLKDFNRRRSYYNHEQQIYGFLEKEDVQTDIESPLLLKCLVSFTTDDKYDFDGRFGWIEDLTNDLLYKRISKLPDEDKEFLTLMFIDELTTKEIAQIRKITVQGVHYHLNRIKNILISL